jgi:hypothetical protein
MYRMVIHIQDYELHRRFPEVPENTLPLRIKYLMNQISEEELKYHLQIHEKRREKIRDIRNVFTMFCDVMSDMFRQFILDQVTQDQLIQISEELRLYTTESFAVIHKRYNCVTPFINEKYEMATLNYKSVKKDLQ